MEKQNNRETIILTVAAMLKQANPKSDNTSKLIALDSLVCEALEIDPEEYPPEYILPF